MEKSYGMWFIKYKIQGEQKWNLLQGQRGYWYADPMLFEYKGEKYLFMEAFDMKWQIGHIAASVYKEGRFTVPRVVIRTGYHMSYPCVFERNGTVYMLPETSQKGTLELWKAGDDLFSWTQYRILKDKVKYADSTVLSTDKKIYLASYEECADQFITHFFELNPDTFILTEFQKDIRKKNNKRPAGNFIIQTDGTIYRPVQNNIRQYGESMIVCRIDSLEPFTERDALEVSTETIEAEEYERTHTLAYDGSLTVVDVYKEEKVPFYYCMINIRRIRNGIYKVIYAWKKKKVGK